jgi:uncharacterized protein (UPF0332 family)
VSFDWRDYLQLARRLTEGTANEAAKRAAISRAYYAAYNMTRRFLLIQARGEGSHRVVWDTADKDSREVVKRAGKKGWKLKERREMADYEPRMESLDYRLTESLELAQQILELLYPPPPTPPPAPSAPTNTST